MKYTVSTHNGSAVARDHNIRNRNVTDKEPHIDPDRIYEIWADERPQDAYRRLFGEAVQEYNDRQKRAEKKQKVEEKQGTKRRATQNDINAFFG